MRKLGSVWIVAGAIAATVALDAQSTRKISVGDGEIVADIAGTGPTVVFLHGSFMDRGTWDRQFPAFSRRFRTVRYDIRPFGESSVPPKPYLPTDDLRRLLDELITPTAHLVGHSFGGQVALDFALAHPGRVASVAVVNSGLGGFAMPAAEQKEAMQVFINARDSEAKAVEAWLALSLWAASRDRPDVMEEIARVTTRSASRFRMAAPPFAPVMPPTLERLGEIRAPTLVVTGDRDTPGNREASATIAKSITGATLKTIAGADHAIPIGWAAELNALLLEFLAKQTR